MAEKSLEKELHAVSEQEVEIPNIYGEKLVGVLHETGSKKLVIVCHGFRSTKEDKIMLNLTAALTSQGFSAFRFDFSGNGESEGMFEFGNYRKEAEDLHAVVLHFVDQKYEINAIIGHSKGGDVVLFYASRYHDVHRVINLSGRFDLKRGVEERLGKNLMERIVSDGFVDVKDKNGNLEYRVTKESLMERLNTDMQKACLSIDRNCRVFTVHGSEDEIIPVEDAYEIAKVVPNHKVHIIEGANHCYTKHQEELAKVVLDLLKSSQVEETSEK